MKKSFVLTAFLFLAFYAAFAAGRTGGLRLDVSIGYGWSSAGYESMTAEDFGDAYWGDSTKFSDDFVPSMDYLKRGKLGLDWYLSDSFAMGIAIAYANRPFRHTFPKGTAPTDYVFKGYYEMLECSVGLKSILWKHLYLGGGISVNTLLNKEAYELYDGLAMRSYLDLADDTSGAFMDLGVVFPYRGNAIFVFAKYNGDLGETFPYEWVLSHITLIDLSLNIGLSVPLS